MKKFSEFLNEMARPTGEPINSKNKDRSKEWDIEFIKNKKFIKKVSKVKPNMSLYKYGNTYVLTDDKDNYIAHIDIHEIDVNFNNKKKKAFSITNGNSNIRGRYIVLLLSVLEHINIDFIFSDIMLSDGAIKFYRKILKGGLYHSYVLQYGNVQEPEEGVDYFNNNSYQIGLSKLEGHIKRISEELNTFRKSDNGYNDIAALYTINEEV